MVSSDKLRRALVDALFAGLRELDPQLLIERALTEFIELHAGYPRGRVVVVAAGKASVKMAWGAMQCLSAHIDDGLAITVEHTPSGPPAPIRMIQAAHPILDARSVVAAETALSLVKCLGADDLLLAMISGGASSLLAAPPIGVALKEKQALVKALLDSGATIQEVNLVRRHFSRIKGGRLAALAHPARVLTFLISDVIHGVAHDIGSGPTVPDPTTNHEALMVIKRRAPRMQYVSPWLSESFKPANTSDLQRWTRIVADPLMLSESVASALRALTELSVRVLPPEAMDAQEMVAQRIALARSLKQGEAAVISCEPTLGLPDHRGKGGRAGWIALAAMRHLPADTMLLCAASDGVDGSSESAGAVVTQSAAINLSAAAIQTALDTFDDAPMHKALGTQIQGIPMGHNLTDLHIVVRQ